MNNPTAGETNQNCNKADKANQWLLEFLQRILTAGKTEVARVRRKLCITYWVLIVLSVIMFFIGMGLISIPALAAWRGDIAVVEALIPAGLGIADVTALYFFQPIERVHRLMGDIGQITLIINSYQTQVGLRLLETKLADRATMGAAADHVQKAVVHSVELIQRYFENPSPEGLDNTT